MDSHEYIALHPSLSLREVEKLMASHGFAMSGLYAALGEFERYDTEDVLRWMGY